jgi:hypothetical protein
MGVFGISELGPVSNLLVCDVRHYSVLTPGYQLDIVREGLPIFRLKQISVGFSQNPWRPTELGKLLFTELEDSARSAGG